MTSVPSDVLAFLAELEQFSTALIEKYYTASEEDIEKDALRSTKQFKYYTPMTVQVVTEDGVLARFMEEGVDLYPEDKKNENG